MDQPPDPRPHERPTPANGLWLRPGEWIAILVVTVTAVLLTPAVWSWLEPVELLPDHRTPTSRSDDYWLFERQSERAAAEADVLVLGDSFVWGAYAARDATLPHFLQAADGRRFANLGVQGAHPVALDGIVRLHGDALQDRTVLVHCNLLWLSSPRHDLSDDKEFAFNHPDLAPQFDRSLTVYRADLDERLGRAIAQRSEFAQLCRHAQFEFFAGGDLASWTIANPYDVPVRQVAVPAPGPAEQPVPWTRRGIAAMTPDWVPLDRSVQWRAFGAALSRLRAQGNRVVVLVGPFNVHLLTEQGRRDHTALRAEVARRLEEDGYPTLVPDPLPSELYADASHPLGEGYAELARRIVVP